MFTWQGLEKTYIGIYFSYQLWLIKIEYLRWSTLKSNYYQTLIDFELIFFFTWFNMLYTTTFMFIDLDFIYTRICYGFLNENNHQEYSVLFVTVYYPWGEDNSSPCFLVISIQRTQSDSKVCLDKSNAKVL
jgi:hypothetical protein